VKRILLSVCVFFMAGMLFSGSAAAGNAGGSGSDYKLGVGYQGMWVQGFLNGVSARIWTDTEFGMEGNLYMGNVDGDFKLYILEGKAMFAPIIKQNSRFYVGGLLSVASYDFDGADGNMWGLGVFLGSEWFFPDFPEIGFNFDVGYKYYNDNDDLDITLWGIDATWGIHYYF